MELVTVTSVSFPFAAFTTIGVVGLIPDALAGSIVTDAGVAVWLDPPGDPGVPESPPPSPEEQAESSKVAARIPASGKNVFFGNIMSLL
ncbi:hypothetical protein GCM10027360_70860 [Amycolatopsis echigonensis]